MILPSSNLITDKNHLNILNLRSSSMKITMFVAIKSYDSRPDNIVKRLTRRDYEDGDMVGIIFDSYHDLRTGFFFGVTVGGVKIDQMMTNDGKNKDETWDPNRWYGTSINHEGWFAEMKIPFSQKRSKGIQAKYGTGGDPYHLP